MESRKRYAAKPSFLRIRRNPKHPAANNPRPRIAMEDGSSTARGKPVPWLITISSEASWGGEHPTAHAGTPSTVKVR